MGLWEAEDRAMAVKRRVPHVAIAYPVAVPWMALFVRGVVEYADRHGGWDLTTSPPTITGSDEFAITIENLKGWPGDGVIAAVGNRREARAARRLGVPVVNLAATTQDVGLPRVMVDHYSMGRLAAEHLLERGLRRLAYCGIEGRWYSQLRCQGFAARARQAGLTCDVFQSSPQANRRQNWQQRVAPLAGWLKTLKPPVGVLAVHDYRARTLVDECRHLGLRIPHDVAVVGLDNDPTVCEYCQPTLTSVSRNAWRVGYEAAAMLDVLMSGRTPPLTEVLIAPDGVAARQSTDTVAIDDPHVADAVHFIHEHLGQTFGVAQVVQAVRISRRELEARFHRAVEATPYDYICRARVERAKRLLEAHDPVKLRTVAAACGFSGVERMRLVFLRTTGTTPAEYRRCQRIAAFPPG
jgi:LacI family transcriptional regulator